MGNEKEAERNVDAAKESINSAIKSLSGVVVDRCDGYYDYKQTYISKLRIVMNELLEIRSELE